MHRAPPRRLKIWRRRARDLRSSAKIMVMHLLSKPMHNARISGRAQRLAAQSQDRSAMTDRSNVSFARAIPRRRTSRWLLATALALALAGLAPSAPAAGDQPYASLHIVSPQPNATIRDNRGTVRVVVQLVPPLRVDQGDHLTLWLDGHATAQMAGAEHRLTNVDRGTHTIQVKVDAKSGAMLMQSEPVIFHMHQASRLAPNRKH